MSKIIYGNKSMNDVDFAIQAAHQGWHKAKKLVQVAAVSVLNHAYKHGDYTKANLLIEGLQGLNQTALVEYFVQFGGFKVSEEEKGFVGWSGADHIRENYEAAKATMWWDLKVQNPWAGFNLQSEIVKLVAKADKANERAAKDEEAAKKVSIDSLMLAELERLVA